MATSEADPPWLIIIDPQRIFADPDSPWGSPMFDGILEPVRRLVDHYRADRTIVTRWVAPRPASGGWADYLSAWPFANTPPDDPQFEVVDELADIPATVLTTTTFGKWGAELTAITGQDPHLILAGVSTDCCVISTALAAADGGARVIVVSDACAGSTPDNHLAALDVMSLYPPQITITTTDALLG